MRLVFLPVLVAFLLLRPLAIGQEEGLSPAAPPNVLLLCIDDLRPELKCFGAGYIQSPHLDRLAATGRAFTRHYVQAPTCGASRYALLTGRYGPTGNDALFARARAESPGPPTLPELLRQHGYTTVSVGKVSHHPGGLGGPDWNDTDQVEMPGAWNRSLMPCGPWKHPRGAMHGLAYGQIRDDPGRMRAMEAVPGPDSTYPDGLITAEALRQLDILASAEAPFLLAVGLIRPHLPFGAPALYREPYDGFNDPPLPPIPHPQRPAGRTTWHGSGEFMKYDRNGRDPRRDADFADQVRRHYAACVTYADAQVGRLLGKLEELDLRDNTLIVVWGDHGWHLGEHGIWGKHSLFEESLRSPLIVVAPQVQKPDAPSAAVVETIDLFPTLCALTGVPAPPALPGVSLLPQLRDPAAPGHTALSYTAKALTLRTASHRLIAHEDGYLELYDHRTPEAETRNLAADQPELAAQLHATLTALRDR